MTPMVKTFVTELVQDHIVNSLDGYLQEVCPTRKPLREESAAQAKGEADH